MPYAFARVFIRLSGVEHRRDAENAGSRCGSERPRPVGRDPKTPPTTGRPRADHNVARAAYLLPGQSARHHRRIEVADGFDRWSRFVSDGRAQTKNERHNHSTIPCPRDSSGTLRILYRCTRQNLVFKYLTVATVDGTKSQR
uniref:Uncharacterized protein n=1 Tax=Sipha flava TaxID=143950 RepID=A0A2S2QXA1_9HEMI